MNHIETKIDEFEQYITIQFGKNVKNSSNIDKFLQIGFIIFEKRNNKEEIIELYKQNPKQDQNFVSIRIGDKELNFEDFKKIIKKMMAKNIYTYGKKGNNFKKVIKIAELINGILYELNINNNSKFNKTYEVSSLEIIDKTIIKVPQLEKDLNDLRNMNAQIKVKNFEALSNNPSLQYLNNFDLYDLDSNNNNKNIENYFPNINELNNKSNINSIIHYNIFCNSCDMNPIIGIRYKCKICDNFNYCEKCMETNINSHSHEFTKIENPIDSNDIYKIIPSFLSIFLLMTRIKKDYSIYKGLFFYKTSKDDFELDILKIFNKLLNDNFNNLNNKYPISFYKKLPFHYNLLLCYEDCSESIIYSFCARAINCIDNCLFVIVRPEEMKISSEKFFFKTFNRLLEAKKNNLNSCIIILYINQASHIIKQLKKIKEKCGFPEEPPVFNQIEKTKIKNLKDLPIEIITSDSPRVGKTTYIAKKVNNNSGIYSFSLGNIDKKFLSYLINKIKNSKKKKISIIFQIYQNPEENAYLLIRNFLFKFLILKYYDKYNYIFDDNISIYIEISSDYFNYNKDFKILDLFKRKNIEFKNNKNFYEEYENKILTNGYNYLKIRRLLTYLNFLKNGEINSIPLKIFQEIKSFLLTDSQFGEIIKTFFIDKFSSSKILPNYGQIQIFINLLNDLIYHFEKNKDMNPDTLKKEIQANSQFEILKNIREKIIGNYVDLVVKFSSMSYESILENQEVAAKNQKDMEYKLTKEYKLRLIEQLNKKRIISYREIKPSIVLFNNNIDNKAIKYLGNCSIITVCKEDEEEFKQLKVLYCDYLQQEVNLDSIDDEELSKEYCIRQLNNICVTSDQKMKEIFNEEKLKDYEFTCDNYIKMVLIYLRIRANIPLILLGETGCGKTSLIKALSYFLEDEYKLIEFNIHSGISYEDILLFLYKNNLLKERKDEEEDKLIGLIKEKDEEEKFEEIEDRKENKILFIDEVNTTNSLNLLVDLFTKKSFIGNSLKDNVYVIGACNPYRLMLSKNEEIGYINKKRHHVRNLIYTVNPLPLSLINYVFDFGNLREEEEKKYINSFIQSFLSNSFSQGENNKEIYNKIFKILCDSVYECQTFIRDNSEVSSVSLREIQRFKKFYEFFLDITSQEKEFQSKKEPIDGKPDHNKNDIDKEISIYLKAANLSLYVCYYLRIIDHKKREELEKKLDVILKFPFLDYPHKLENEIANNMNLNKGIAKNRALLDNIFTLFVCLNVKIPIFICGKAGCSKTLSFSLLYQSMKGEYSDSELFKKYPKLYVNSYQGSLTSNSLEIQTIFKRAKNVARNIKRNEDKKSQDINKTEENKEESNKNEVKNDKTEENKEESNKKEVKNNDKPKILSVILFDEMGLAELSPNNPLKVIHSELDNNNNEIGFVGISNWSLDASKMNRGVHLSIPEPSREDLKYTAITIATGIYEEIEAILPYKKIIQNLAESYFDYKQLLHQKYITSYDFHGARDFYFLIKIAARILKRNISEQSSESIAMESIERNFGGLELDKEDNIKWNSIKKFKQIFSRYQENVESIDKYDVFSCVQKNIEEENNRYLLLITDRTKNDTLIEYILKKLKLNYRFIQGSKLKEDQNEGYVLQKSWSVISSMEKGEIIILKDMEILYPKFYDLFNQNLQKYGNSLYAKIVLDSTTNERHIVNDKFRCIILLEKNNVDEQDPPFLNRFEKHLISFKYILTEKQNHIAEELFEEIRDLTTIPENKNYPPLLVNINIEEIRCLLLELSMAGKDIDNKLNQVYKLLIPTFSQENVLSSIFSQEKKYIKKDEIIQIYEENSHTNVYQFLENVKKNKLIIYTFSPYYKDLFNENEDIKVENKKFGNICKENTLEFTFNEKLSENMLNYFFELYYEKKNCNLFVVHFKVKDSKFMKYIKFQLDDYHKKVKEDENKIFLFIIHIKKNKSAEYLEKYYSFFFSFLSEYQQITIDNLTDQKNISVINLFKKTNEELLVIKELFDVNFIIKKEFSRQIIKIGTNENNSFNDKLDNLSENGIFESIIKNIQNSIKNSENILRKILIDYSNLKDKDYDFISYFVEKIEKLISDNVSKLIRELAENGYLVSFIVEKEIPKEIKKTILSFIDNINLKNSNLDNNLDNYMLDLKIPGSKLLFRKFFSLVLNCKNEYINKEDEYRKKPKKKDENSNKEITLEDVHFDKKQYLKNRLWNEELLSEDIFNHYNQKIIEDFIYLLFYNKEKNSKITKIQEGFVLFLYEEKNKNDNLSDRFLSFFLWAGCYQETIFKFLEIINTLNKYFFINTKDKDKDKDKEKANQPDLLKILKDIYDSVDFPEEEDNEKKKGNKTESTPNENRKEKVNGIFYRISESICQIIINPNYIDYTKIKNLELLCEDLNKITQIFSQFNITLSLSLRKQYSLNSILKLIEYYIKVEKKDRGKNDYRIKLNNFIKNIYNEFNYISSNSISEATNSFKEQLKIIIDLSEELSVKIFVNKLLEYMKNKPYKLEIVKILFENPSLIKYSTLFFNYIFLFISIKPKKQTKAKMKEDEKDKCIKEFSDIFNKNKKDEVLIIIDKQSENNEILKEILIYIFELQINSYFEDCRKSKFIEKSHKELLLGLNFDYYQNCCININEKKYGKFKNLEMIFYFSFIRCYLNYFVNLQIEEREIGDLSKFHKDLLKISNSNLGKLISLYIGKLFSLNNLEDYFLNNYLKEEENNWKNLIIGCEKKIQMFSIKNYDNSNHLLFDLWDEINNKNSFSKDYLNTIEISEIAHIINFGYNEMSQRNNESNFVVSKLVEEVNKIKESFQFKSVINIKIKKIFEQLSDLNFFNNNSVIKSNLLLFFNIIKLYIIGFAGTKNNNLTSLIYSHDFIGFIQIFYNYNLKKEFLLIESFYRIKEFLEENNNLPAYFCKCGKWYPVELDICSHCKESFKKNITLIFNNEDNKKKYEIENRNKRIGYKKKTLKEIKEEIIIPILRNSPSIDEVLFNNKELDDNNFVDIFINYIFLCQLFIEIKFEFKSYNNDRDIFDTILQLNKSIDNFLATKKTNIYDFLNYFSDYYIEFLIDNNFIKKQKLLYEFIKAKYTNKIEDKKEDTFKNLETNILTRLVINNDNNKSLNLQFKDKNLKYLLTATKYPNLNDLEKAVLSHKKKPLPILKTFISVEKEKSQSEENKKGTKIINKLTYIEEINNFINAFSEENKNLISRQKIDDDTIEKYLKNSRKDEHDISPLDLKFEKFCVAYDEITNVAPYNMSKDQPVKTILNDKEEDPPTPIYRLYSHLIKIQNEFLLKIIEEFEKTKNDNENLLIQNAIQQIKQKIPIQLATKADIFEFNVKNNIILSFEELFSFYSMKNIFNKLDNKIDYSKYSNLKYKLSSIEKELINIILTGKKLFADEQITYEFYLDPYKVEEKTKKFENFTELYDREELTDSEKESVVYAIENLKKIFLPNLEILIDYLLNQKKYQSRQSISDIKFNTNLYLNPEFIRFFDNNKTIMINKLISLYEFLEEKLWITISDRYVNKCFHCTGNLEKIKAKINEYIKDENSRELKNDKLISLLIKFICRYLPYEKDEIQNKDLFKTILEKNSYLSSNIKNELMERTKTWGIKVKDAIDLTQRIASMIQKENKVVPDKLSESIISGSSQIPTDDNPEDEEDDDEEGENNDERDF